MGLTILFDRPFYTGAAVASSPGGGGAGGGGSSVGSGDLPFYLPVAIDGHGYVIDPTQYQRQTMPVVRPQSDISIEPGEQSLSQEALWRRSQSSFHYGGGKQFFDDDLIPTIVSLPKESMRRHFWKSKGVDPWTQGALTLLNDTARKRTSTNTNLAVLLVGSRFYVADGTEVYFTSDLVTDPTVWTAATINVAESAQTVQSITTDGAVVFAALGSNGIHKTTAGASSSTHLSAFAATLVQYANGRLIAANGANLIAEVKRDGTTATIYTHPNPNFTWSSIAAAPNAIYMGGTSTDRSDVFYTRATDDTGALVAPVFAMSLPDGETLNDMVYYGKTILLGTSSGLRIAAINSDNTLTYGPVILIPGGVNALEGQGQYCWFSWSNYDLGSTGLGRTDLSVFMQDLVPVYASDLMATAQGTVKSVASFGGRRYFAVSGVGIFGELSTPVPSGTLESGWIKFGTIEKKIVNAFDLRHLPLPTGASITATLEMEDGTLVAAGTSNVPSTLSPLSAFTMEANNAEAFNLHLTLGYSQDHTLAPTLKRWTLYAMASPVNIDEIIVPIIMKERVVARYVGEGLELDPDPAGEIRFLKQLESSRRVVRYQEGTQSFSVYVSRIIVKPDAWNPNTGFFDGMVFVRLLTAKVGN